jgi:hypothetical protein
MRSLTSIELWIKVLKENEIPCPFTTKQAYSVICNSPNYTTHGALVRRKKIPGSTNELSQRLKRSKEVKRVNKKCSKRSVALWDFVDD